LNKIFEQKMEKADNFFLKGQENDRAGNYKQAVIEYSAGLNVVDDLIHIIADEDSRKQYQTVAQSYINRVHELTFNVTYFDDKWQENVKFKTSKRKKVVIKYF
jgi:hypothetical protein